MIVGHSRFTTGFAADPSGQVLIGQDGSPYSSLLRLSAADGSPVRSFGADGAVSLPRHFRVAALGFARDGDAVVLGIDGSGGAVEPGAVLRYRPNGQPDSAFGHNGRLPLRLPSGNEVEAGALVAAAGGRFLVGGMDRRRFVVTRLLPDGRPDPRFGSGGWSLASAGGTAKSLTLSRAGSHIYLAGIAGEEGHLHVVLVRFDADGHLDTAFGHHGRLIAPISKPAQPKAIVPSRDGVLVVLSGGPRPLLSFDRGGRVHRDWVGPRPQLVDNVRATISGGQLVLGWNAFSRALFRRGVYYLAKRPLVQR